MPYAYRAGTRPLELDVWLPDTTHGPLPVVLYLHGGGWSAGTRTTSRCRHNRSAPADWALIPAPKVPPWMPSYMPVRTTVHCL